MTIAYHYLNQPFFSRVTRNLFTHSGHFPLTLLILEVLLSGPGYFSEPDAYILLFAGFFQAAINEYLIDQGKPSPFLGNLAGALVYSLSESMIEGVAFFQHWHHQAYWFYALGFGLLHWLQARRTSAVFGLVMLENILRASIPLVMYSIFELESSGGVKQLSNFLDDSAHVFLTIVLLLLGALLGFEDLNLRRSLSTIQALTKRLKEYSAWSLGNGILDRAIADENILSLHRLDRAVLFLDIRGFTAWSELETPEAVVNMLNRYYRAAEGVLGVNPPIKLKFTADEVMAVFPNAKDAILAGQDMLNATILMLDDIGLSAGAGIHFGSVIEGVLGGDGSKAYDFIGDTVNTAQRLCDSASAGELLVSIEACTSAEISTEIRRSIAAKGKRTPVVAAVFTV